MIPLEITRVDRQSPAPVGVYLAPERDVRILPEPEVISSVHQPYTLLLAHFILGRQQAGTLPVGERENGKRNEQGGRHAFHLEVGRPGYKHLVRYDLYLFCPE